MSFGSRMMDKPTHPQEMMCGKLYYIENLPYACLMLKGHKGPHRTHYDWANDDDPEVS